jgi:osmotically-inducible protein OsmY
VESQPHSASGHARRHAQSELANSILLALLGSALCVLTACASSPPRTPEERALDADTAAKVEAVLLADPRIYARHIDVRVDRGTAHLEGLVWASQDFLIAKNDAASVAGVIAVRTNLELVRGGISGTSR